MTSSCNECTKAAADPYTGVYSMDCDDCYARLLANSPGFHASMGAMKFRRDYLDALKSRWGANWETGHRIVRKWDDILRGVNA